MHINQLTPASEILRELGGRLARVRKQRGFAQTGLAEEAGIGVATLRRIEGGQDSQLESWIKLLKALDMVSAHRGHFAGEFQLPHGRSAGRCLA